MMRKNSNPSLTAYASPSDLIFGYFRCRLRIRQIFVFIVLAFLVIICYLNSYIQFETNKVIINMRPDESAKLKDLDPVTKTERENVNVHIVNRIDIDEFLRSHEVQEDVGHNLPKPTTTTASIQDIEAEMTARKLAKIFSKIDSQLFKIQEPLSANISIELGELRSVYEFYMEKHRIRYYSTTKKPGKEKEKILFSILPMDLIKIKREDVIKFLKYEKVKYKEKIQKGKLLSGQSLAYEIMNKQEIK